MIVLLCILGYLVMIAVTYVILIKTNFCMNKGDAATMAMFWPGVLAMLGVVLLILVLSLPIRLVDRYTSRTSIDLEGNR